MTTKTTLASPTKQSATSLNFNFDFTVATQFKASNRIPESMAGTDKKANRFITPLEFVKDRKANSLADNIEEHCFMTSSQ